MKRVPSTYYVQVKVCKETTTVYTAQLISWTLALFCSFFLKISFTEENTVEPLMSRHAYGNVKNTVTEFVWELKKTRFCKGAHKYSCPFTELPLTFRLLDH